jgi:Ran GTPase-activating protein 1
MTSVEDADLSDVIAGRLEDLALRVLTVLCSSLSGRTLTSIDVSDNAMGEKGINACKAVLAGQPALQSLRMCNDGLSASAMEAMRDLLLEGAAGAEGEESSSGTGTQLRKLHFFNNMSGDGGAKVSMLCWRLRINLVHEEPRMRVWQLRALS